MTDNTTPDSTETTTDGVAAPPRRRRRVTRDVITPAPAPEAPAASEAAVDGEPVAEEEPAQDEALAPQDGTDPVEEPEPEPVAVTAPAPRVRRSRRVSRTVVVPPPAEQGPAPAVADEQPVEAPAAETPAEEAAVVGTAPDGAVQEPAEDASSAAPAPARRRRARATKAAAAPAPGPDAPTSESPEPQEPDASSVEDEGEPAPARKSAARRSRRKAADVTPSPEQPVEVPVGEEPSPTAADEPVRGLDVLAEFRSAAPATTTTTGQAPARARLATTAVLFQSPDASTRPRRRRAQASAGSPEEISQAAHVEDVPVAPEDEQGAEAEQPSSDQEQPARGRRRGRGGRGRARRDEQPVDETADEPAVADAPDEAVADDLEGADEAGTDSEDGADEGAAPRRRRRRGGRGRRGRSDAGSDEEPSSDDEGDEEPAGDPEASEDDGAGDDEQSGSSRRRRRRRRGSRGESAEPEARRRPASDEVTALRGSTRLEAKRQRRREGRDAGRRRQIITEAEFLARREAVERTMVVRERSGRTQIAVLEDGVLVEHYVSHQAQASMVGNVYLGRVQNVLPSMEAAFVDVGKGRNAVLYAGEVNWDAAGLEGQPRRIEQALKSGDPVLVQVTKDPIGHKGARLTSQITLAGRYLVYVPGGGMTGISRKLPDTERSRLKKILRDVVPESAGVIVRTAAEGASEEELTADIARLQSQWEAIEKKSRTASAPALLQGEPDMAIRVVRDIFNDDFSSLVVQGDDAHTTIASYVGDLAPDLASKVTKWTGTQDLFTVHRVDEQLAKGMDRKVWLPSGGSLVIDRTEAMTVVDVNTGKFTGAGGTLEETVTRNNLEAAEEIVRQLRLRDIGGIIVIDFIDMVLESNRDLVLRRLVECLGRDRTKHQVAEVTSLGLVQMTRKRVGQGLVEAFSETCEHCHGRGFIVHTDPVEKGPRPEQPAQQASEGESKRSRRKRAVAEQAAPAPSTGSVPVLPEAREAVKATLATIAAAAAHAHDHDEQPEAATPDREDGATSVAEPSGPVSDEDAPPSSVGLDVIAELASAGRVVVGGHEAGTEAVQDVVLELHAVAPEVFALDQGESGGDEPVQADGDEPDAATEVADSSAPPAPEGAAEELAGQTVGAQVETDEAPQGGDVEEVSPDPAEA